MQSKFFISKGEDNLGPFTLDEIAKNIQQSKLQLSDYIYVEAKKDWILLMEFKPITDRLKANKPAAPPKPSPSQAPASNENQAPKAKTDPDKVAIPTPQNAEQSNPEWYVLKGENKYGPFSYLDLIRMLQEKVVFEFDYVWTQGMSTWNRIAEVEKFSPDQIRDLKDQHDESLGEVFFRRRHSRCNFGGSILVHDNRNLWKGKGINISRGGAGILMENSMIVPGQTLYLHFKPGDEVPPFNAICEVVSKRFEKNVKSAKAPVLYGVKFTSISDDAQNFLDRYTEEAS